MSRPGRENEVCGSSRLLVALARDRSGNTLALIAAAIMPLLGLVGGGIDMGRAYLASNRLQQACDAGVLAARKRLGTQVTVTGAVPEDTASIGQRFFNLNFRAGSYGTRNRDFAMTLEEDYAIAGAASVDVPTHVMGVFGYDNVPVEVNCASTLSVTALDVMLVLDVTGSMRDTVDGDSEPKIDALKAVIRGFHAQLEGAKAPSSIVRYGFVPYATNVNVGHLLRDEWVADRWTYQSRIETGRTLPPEPQTSYENFNRVSGTQSDWTIVSTYPAAFQSTSGTDREGRYRCDRALPEGSDSREDVVNSTETRTQTEPYPTTVTTEYVTRTENGRRYRQQLDGTTCRVETAVAEDYVQTFERIVRRPEFGKPIWSYRPVDLDVSDWRDTLPGCIEERATQQLSDFTNVDFSRSPDLDIDLVPSVGNPDSQWKPYNGSVIYARSFENEGNGEFTTEPVETAKNFADTGNWWFSDCPAKAQNLTEMDTEAIDDYLATLQPHGATYHDIGMIWGARLLSPTGLFRNENADRDGIAKTRHLIFLTDGMTEPYDLAYGAYGIEGLDHRRWSPSAPLSLAETIEGRFGVGCREARKRNINVWVVAFGTEVTDAMKDCAGSGRYFEAANSAQLNRVFTVIAKTTGDLRLSR